MVQRAKRARDGIEWPADEEAAFRAQIAGEFDAFQNIYNFSSHIWLDDIIDPVETRAVMGLALDLAARTTPPETRFGVLRM
jgi:3-methylcrotonyl-CoA carboxylase beta subunit